MKVAFVLLSAVSGTVQGALGVKPKRKKPGTAVKRKVQPIAVDAKGKQTSYRSTSHSTCFGLKFLIIHYGFQPS